MLKKKSSEILKLPPVCNCFTLTMTNKLVVITNNLKHQKLRKFYYTKWNFFVPNYSGLQNPWLGGYRPQIPILSVPNWICWTPPRKKFLGTPLNNRSLKVSSTHFVLNLNLNFYLKLTRHEGFLDLLSSSCTKTRMVWFSIPWQLAAHFVVLRPFTILQSGCTAYI